MVFAFLSFHIDLLMNDDLEYGDQSYINNDILRAPPPIPAPLPPALKKDLLQEDESLSGEEVFNPPEINLPPEMDVDASFKEGSLDELIGLAPEKEEKKNMKDLLNKVKGQTNSMIQKIFRRGSNDTDLLGIQSETANSDSLNNTDPFTSIPEANSLEAGVFSNDDVDDLFGLVSLDAVERTFAYPFSWLAESETPTEITEESESKRFFRNADDHYYLFLSVLALAKMVTPAEMQKIREAGDIDKKGTLRILQSFLEK